MSTKGNQRASKQETGVNFILFSTPSALWLRREQLRRMLHHEILLETTCLFQQSHVAIVVQRTKPNFFSSSTIGPSHLQQTHPSARARTYSLGNTTVVYQQPNSSCFVLVLWKKCTVENGYNMIHNNCIFDTMDLSVKLFVWSTLTYDPEESYNRWTTQRSCKAHFVLLFLLSQNTLFKKPDEAIQNRDILLARSKLFLFSSPIALGSKGDKLGIEFNYEMFPMTRDLTKLEYNAHHRVVVVLRSHPYVG
jgi:hypothetical protein